jgi:hypothetical protein
MKDQKARKCAPHIPCLCEVEDGEEYCGNCSSSQPAFSRFSVWHTDCLVTMGPLRPV